MAPLDSLPPDQRAVIQLVLQRGRSYDQIAAMLSIDRAGVRQRALDGFDALGPSSSIADPQRALLTDYLLGQLPGRVAEQVRDRLAASPPDRAWLRVVASEVAPLTNSPLPEIPAAGSRGAAAAPETAATAAALAEEDRLSRAPGSRDVEPARARRPVRRPAATRDPVADGDGATNAGTGMGGRPAGSGGSPSSRRGGAIILGLAAAIIAAIVIVLIVTSGGSTKPKSTASRTSSTPTTTTSTTPTTSTTATKAKLLARVTLVPTTSAKGRGGIAEVIREGTTLGVVIVAQGMPANTTSNAYGVWLANSSADSKMVGFVNQRVGSNGRLETEGPLPANAARYKQILVTLEHVQHPKAPGQIILEGAFRVS